MKKICILTYGCAANFADSEIMAGLLKEKGFEIVNNPKKCDLIILNTCIVKTPTENRMIHKIKELTKLGKPLIVAGCMPVVEKNIIEKINPKASLIGPYSIEKVVFAVEKTLKGKKIVLVEEKKLVKTCFPRLRKNPVIHILTISQGCLSNCSYCVVKFARGNLKSYTLEEIVKEAREAIKNGCKEIWITSQDNACYGKDIKTDLSELLNEICKIEGKFFVRVGMMNPFHLKPILSKIIKTYKNPKIFKFLHLPVQSGSNRILKLMKRGYKVKDFLSIVKKFRKEIPELTLSTDIIVGFPTESEKDFEKTLKLIEKVKPDIVNISKFGKRPKTKAGEMEQIDRKTINKRSKIISELVRKISFESNKKWIGWNGEVLIDEIKNFSEGRNFAYKPILIKEKLKLGSFVNVKIVQVRTNYLLGEKF